MNMFSHKSYCLHRLEDGQLSTSLLRTETQILRKHYSRQELMHVSKARFVNDVAMQLDSAYYIGVWLYIEN